MDVVVSSRLMDDVFGRLVYFRQTILLFKRFYHGHQGHSGPPDRSKARRYTVPQVPESPGKQEIVMRQGNVSGCRNQGCKGSSYRMNNWVWTSSTFATLLPNHDPYPAVLGSGTTQRQGSQVCSEASEAGCYTVPLPYDLRRQLQSLVILPTSRTHRNPVWFKPVSTVEPIRRALRYPEQYSSLHR